MPPAKMRAHNAPEGVAVNLVYVILVGLVAGWLAGILMKAPSKDLLRNLVIGLLGGLIGGWLLPMVGLTIGGGLLGSIVMATLGAVILIAVLRAVL